MLIDDNTPPHSASPPLPPVCYTHGASAVFHGTPQSVGDQTGSIKGRRTGGGAASAASPGGPGMCVFDVIFMFSFYSHVQGRVPAYSVVVERLFFLQKRVGVSLGFDVFFVLTTRYTLLPA